MKDTTIYLFCTSENYIIASQSTYAFCIFHVLLWSLGMFTFKRDTSSVKSYNSNYDNVPGKKSWLYKWYSDHTKISCLRSCFSRLMHGHHFWLTFSVIMSVFLQSVYRWPGASTWRCHDCHVSSLVCFSDVLFFYLLP